MRKIDYQILAQTIKRDIDAFNLQKDKQVLLGLSDDIHGEALENIMQAIKTLDSKIAYCKLLAHSLGSKLSVDKAAFIRECGVWSGSVFD